MANLKIVDDYNLPAWADMGLYLKPEYLYRMTVAFSGEQDGKGVRPTHVGLNPFDEESSFSVGGFKIDLYSGRGDDDTIGNLRTSVDYGTDQGVREYEFTKMSSDGDTIVFDVLQSGDPDTVDPDKIIVRELTEQEKKYVDDVQENNLNFVIDRREELS